MECNNENVLEAGSPSASSVVNTQNAMQTGEENQ